VSFRIIPALAALAATVKGWFRRKTKKTVLQLLAPKETAQTRGPSLRGNGKASRALRKARRRRILSSFTRFIARKPIGWGAVEGPGVQWRKGLAQWQALFDERSSGSTTVRLGRRAQKRSARLKYAKKVKAWKRERNVDPRGLVAALHGCAQFGGGQ